MEFSPTIRVYPFEDRKDILEKSRNFVNKLFAKFLKKQNVSIWAEHTPTNISHVLFLKELFPNMKFIHIYRDPRDVVSSYKTKNWGGQSAKDAVPIINSILKKWTMDKKYLPKEGHIEISLENLVSNPEEVLNNLCRFLEIKFDENMLKMDLSKSHSGRWKKDLTDTEIKFVEKELSWFINEKGYYSSN